MPNRRLSVPLFMLLFVLCGCPPHTLSSETDLPPEGEIRFDYRGDLTGTFRARGAVQNELPNGVRYGTWSAAFYHPGSDRIRLVSFDSTRAPNGRVLEVRLGQITGEDIVIDPDCPPSDASCPSARFDPSGTIELLRRGEWSARSYRAIRGSIELRDATSGQLSGWFDAELVPTDGSEGSLIIENGAFNVPILYPDLH